MWNVLQPQKSKCLKYGYHEMHTTGTRKRLLKIQNLLKIALFCVVGTKMCHMCPHKKNFGVSSINTSCLSKSILVGRKHFPATLRLLKAQKCPKNDLKKIFHICSDFKMFYRSKFLIFFYEIEICFTKNIELLRFDFINP